MTELEPEIACRTDEASPSGPDAEYRPSVNARLGPLVSADVEAILNDMEQARALASDYQRALAAKSQEVAELKHTLEKMQRSLAQQPTQGEGGAAQFRRKLNFDPSASAEVEALLNDMEQARDLAADYQRALAGKSNEFAELKQVFEKTQRDLSHLQASVTELREERHRLANDAMRAAALELRVERITNDRDQLRAELEALKKRISTPAVLGLTPVEAAQAENPVDRLENVDLVMRKVDQADRDFIHITYKKEATIEVVPAEPPAPIKSQRSVRTVRTF